MTPYFQDAHSTIYHADFRAVLPEIGRVDAVLTDPPYGIGEAAGKNKTRGKAAAPKDYGDKAWDDAPPSRWIFDWLFEISDYQIVFGGNYFGLPPSRCWLVWDKDNTGDFADCELAWTNLDRAVRRLKYRWNGMLQEPGRPRETRVHPTQKPLPVMSWALSMLPPATAMVLDPFMGSGTTLCAAKLAGIRSIGIDTDEAYCELAARRLSQGVLF